MSSELEKQNPVIKELEKFVINEQSSTANE